MGEIIDGKKVAAEVLEECATEVAELKSQGVTPGLAVVLVGLPPLLPLAVLHEPPARRFGRSPPSTA